MRNCHHERFYLPLPKMPNMTMNQIFLINKHWGKGIANQNEQISSMMASDHFSKRQGMKYGIPEFRTENKANINPEVIMMQSASFNQFEIDYVNARMYRSATISMDHP